MYNIPSYKIILGYCIIFLGQILSTKIIAINDQILKEIVLLTTFIPLLIIIITIITIFCYLGLINPILFLQILFISLLILVPFTWWAGEGPFIASSVNMAFLISSINAYIIGSLLSYKKNSILIICLIISLIPPLTLYYYLTISVWLLNHST